MCTIKILLLTHSLRCTAPQTWKQSWYSRQSHYRRIQVHNGARRAHSCAHNRLQIFCGDPRAALTSKWNPISEPLGRCEWESRFSKLLSKINARLSASHTESLAGAGTDGTPSFFFLLLNHYHKWHPPFRRLASATVKNPFTTRPSLSCDSVVSRSTGGWQEVKRIWREGSRGGGRDGESCEKAG